MTQKVINTITADDVLCFSEALDASEGNNSLDAYQKVATQSAIYPGQGTPFGLMYAALGLAEAGEVQNKVKKAFRDDDVITIGFDRGDGSHDVLFKAITPERKQQIIKELGGALWYIGAVCNEIGATMSEVALTNLEELSSRSQRGTLGGDGDNR